MFWAAISGTVAILIGAATVLTFTAAPATAAVPAPAAAPPPAVTPAPAAGRAHPAAWGKLGPPAGAPGPRPSPAGEIRLRVLAINDFHGALQARSGFAPRAGGAALLAAYLDALESEARRALGASSIRVHAGDMIGFSQAISALWHDEPTLELLDLLRFEYGALGNHELDRGLTELLRLQRGGCRPDGRCFAGVRMQYLAANLVRAGSRRPLLPAYSVREVQGVSVAFIGAVTSQLPRLVPPPALGGARVLDEARAVNRAVAELKRRGVRTVVVLLHEGGELREGHGLEGRIVSILQALHPEVDVVVSGHTHRCYAVRHARLLVTQACSHGTAVAAIDLVIDPASGNVQRSAARILQVAEGHGLRPDPAVAAWVQRWAEQASPTLGRRVALLPEPVRRTRDARGQSPLASLVAEALRWKTGALVAFVNPSVLQADLQAGELTWGELHDALPSGDRAVSLDLTGNQIKRLLEQQWIGRSVPALLQVAGLSYPWHPDRPPGRRVQLRDVRLADGRALTPGGRYRVATTSFLADGGLHFTAFREGTGRLEHGGVVDVVAEFLATVGWHGARAR